MATKIEIMKNTNTTININPNPEPDLKLENPIQKNPQNNTYLKQIKSLNDLEYNNLEYSEALEYDKRTFCQMYYSLIRIKHMIFFTFFIKDDYNLFEIKICLLLFWLAVDYAMNGIFFNDKTMHKIHEYNGEYRFLYHLPIIIYPLIFSSLITRLLECLAIFEDKIAKIIKENFEKTKSEITKKINEYIDSIKRKLVIFFILMILFLLLFWYYLSSFCAVFHNTQKPLIKDTILGYAFAIVYPFINVFIISLLRYSSLREKNKNNGQLYKASNAIGDVILLFIFIILTYLIFN